MKTIDILMEFAVNETNEAGVKGLVIWDDDFEEVSNRIEGLREDKMSANEYLSSWTEENEVCGDVPTYSEDEVIYLMEQYSKYRTT